MPCEPIPIASPRTLSSLTANKSDGDRSADRADDASEDYKDRGQRGHATNCLRYANCYSCGHRLGRERQQRFEMCSNQPSNAHSADDTGRKTNGQSSHDQPPRSPDQKGLAEQGHREQNYRGAKHEVDEPGAPEIVLLRRARQLDRNNDQQAGYQRRVQNRVAREPALQPERKHIEKDSRANIDGWSIGHQEPSGRVMTSHFVRPLFVSAG